MTFSFDICSKFVWVGAIWWALGGIYIFITSLDTVSALYETLQLTTGGQKIYKQQPRYYVVPRLRLQHFNSPRSFLLSKGQTKEITFHHLRSGEYKLYITSHQSVSCWSTKHHNVGGIIGYELTGQQGRDDARHQVDTDPTDGARCDTRRLWSTRFRN